MSQRNPIGDLIVVETVPIVSAVPGDSLQDLKDDIAHEKESVDLEDIAPILNGRCLSDGTYKDVSWTLEEQRKAVRKVDFFLLPIFMVSEV
jgi:hypothetical protein